MYRRMLIPLDGSRVAESVLPQAKELAGRLDLDVVLLHVLNGGAEFLPAHKAYLEKVAGTMKTDVEKIRTQSGGMQGGKVAAKNKPVDISIELVEGNPAEEIIKSADKQADLILIATHGRSGISRWAMGSVADKVLSGSKVPVWLIRATSVHKVSPQKGAERVILVPLDGSEKAEAALSHAMAVALARGLKTQITLVQVCEPPVILSDYPESVMSLSWEQHKEEEKDEVRQLAMNYLSEVQKSPVCKGLTVKTEVLFGRAADEIVDYAGKKSVNLIAMSTHGHTGLSRWAYGSVADRVIHAANSPVLLVRNALSP